MAFDISKLTNVVNKYLYSISDVAKLLEKYEGASEEEKFAAYMRDALSAQGAKTTDTATGQAGTNGSAAVSGVASASDNSRSTRTVQQVQAPQENTADRYHLADTIQNNIKEHMRVDTTFSKVNASTSSGNASDSTAAGSSSSSTDVQRFQDLAKSGYFSSDLVMNSLFDTGNKDDGLSDFDNAANSSILKSGNISTDTLLAAYKSNKSAADVTSIFGDFTL